jgi:hypothetical protein
VQREIVFVEVPVGGSPAPLYRSKPRYPRQTPREPWRPQRAILTRRSKGEAVKRLIDAINRSDEVARAFMADARKQAGVRPFSGHAGVGC